MSWMPKPETHPVENVQVSQSACFETSALSYSKVQKFATIRGFWTFLHISLPIFLLENASTALPHQH